MVLKNKVSKHIMTVLVFAVILSGILGSEKITAMAAGSSSLDSLSAGVTRLIEISNDNTLVSNEGQITDAATLASAQTEAAAQPAPAQQTSEWDTKVMANVNEAVNIRQDASTDSPIVGKLYKGGSADILEAGAEWTKISSGDVVGYAKNEYLAFGEQAKAIAEQEGNLTATVNTETLRVRENMSMDSPVLGLVAAGEKLEAVEVVDNWVSIAISADKVGYVSCDFVTIQLELGKAETIEAIKAREEAEAQAKAEAAAKKAKESAKTNNGAVAVAGDDVQLLGALIQCEAGGESYEGKLGVAATVMNRVRSGAYPNSVYEVIYASGQFTPAGSGKVAAVMASGVSSQCLQAAQEAIDGASNIGSATHFRNVRSGKQGIVIGNHVFW